MMIETKLSKQSTIDRIVALTGNQEIEIFTPFSGSVCRDKFRINRSRSIVHPFVPVATGNVKSSENGSIVELNFVFPWLGHASMFTIIAIYIGMPLSLSWEIIMVIIFVWVLLVQRHKHEKKEFLKVLKENLT